jgi:hypothetical protein
MILGMYGKHFESLYEGSMIGAGAMVFAVWGYVIAKWKPDKKVGGQVRLNPALLGPILGESPKEVEKAIEYLCAPDKQSSSKLEGGRRLVRLGQFDYRVVNAAKYHAIRNEEERREQNRQAQARFREKQKVEPTNNRDNLIEIHEKHAKDLRRERDDEADAAALRSGGEPE